jgi:hypothetical protein
MFGPRLVFLAFLWASAVASPASAESRFAWTVPFPGSRSVPESQLGISMDLGWGFGSGKESNALVLNFSVPYAAYNTVILEPFLGLSALFPPNTPIITPGYENQSDDERVGRLAYGMAVIVRPLGFRAGRHGLWSYPFIGVRWIWLSGLGQTQKALDCLYCSDTEASFHGGGNRYLTVGYLWHRLALRVDYRLTKLEGYYGVSAFDPYYVGPSYDYQQGPYWEPRIIFSFAWYGLWPI